MMMMVMVETWMLVMEMMMRLFNSLGDTRPCNKNNLTNLWSQTRSQTLGCKMPSWNCSAAELLKELKMNKKINMEYLFPDATLVRPRRTYPTK